MSPLSWSLVILAFGIAMFAVAAALGRRYSTSTVGDYLLAERGVSWPWGAPSIAASWIWAPALFVSIQKTYEFGLAGAFWFTAPNVLALLVYCYLAPRIRDQLPEGYTFPGWIEHRFGRGRLHRIYLVPFVWYQLMAVCVQLFVGGLMLQYLTGLPLWLLMLLLLTLTLGYGIKTGMVASIVTDYVQMAMILGGLLITVPLLVATVGFDTIASGTRGTAGSSGIWDGKVAYSFGIVTSIGLLAGAISDQQYWQRAFAIRRGDLRKAFAVGGLLFGIVPALLAIVGLVAASPAAGVVAPANMQLPMIGVEVIRKFLPVWAVAVFVCMLLAGLASTLDSGLLAGASLYAIDLRRAAGHLTPPTLRQSRVGMLLFAVGGLLLAFVVQRLFSLDRLWWIFNGVASCFVVPTVLSVFWKRLSERGAFWGIVVSLLGMIAFVYANWIGNTDLIVGSAVFIVSGNLLVCWLMRTPVSDESGR